MHSIQSRTVSHVHSTLRLVAAYVAGVAFMLGVCTYALAALIGALIVEIPHPLAETTVSRVQRWVQSERDFARLAPVFADRLSTQSSSEPPQGPVPEVVVVETEGGSVASASAAGEPLGRERLSRVPNSQVTYRTVCVRLCDGAYFPLSFATTAKYLRADEALCQSRCGSPARMFYYRNPGQNVASMIDLDGRSYADLQSSFRFHAAYDQSCTCRAQPWDAEAKARHQRYAELEASADVGQRSRARASDVALEPPAEVSAKKSVAAGSSVEMATADPWPDVEPRNGEPLLLDIANGKAEALLLSKAKKSRNARKLAQKPTKSKARAALRDRDPLANVRYASVTPGELVRMHLLGQY